MNLHAGPRVAVALAVSLGVHAAIFAGLLGEGETAQVAGAAAYEAAALGSSFEDLAVAGGILQPVEGDAVEATASGRRIEAERSAAAIAPERTVAAQAVRPPPVERLRPESAARRTVTPSLPLDPDRSDGPPAFAPGVVAALPAAQESEEARLPPPAAAVEPGEAEPVEAEPEKVEPAEAEPAKAEADRDPVEAMTPQPVEARTPQKSEAVERVEPEEAVPPQLAAVPTRRPERIEPVEERPAETARLTEEVMAPVEEEPAKPPVAEKKQRKPERPKKVTTQGPGQGKADRDAVRGAAEGKAEAKSSAAGRGNTAGSPGNAEVSNYAGKVYAKIRRTRQRRAGGRGVVRVSFTISADGGLGSVAVAKGSGADAVDRAAVDHVRRSAPFPAPPPGAQRRFVIPIEVRG